MVEPNGRPLKPVVSGEDVVVRTVRGGRDGMVVNGSDDHTRTTTVRMADTGNTIRRNRRDVIPVSTPNHEDASQSDGETREPVTTRSGRRCRPPAHLKDYVTN